MVAVPGCATHCGLFMYCDIPNGWSTQDTFIVEAENDKLCVSGARPHSCAYRGMYQSGSQSVKIFLSEDEEDESTRSLIATVTVSGAPGDRFTANCFQYEGEKFLGLTSVLTGVEIRDVNGVTVARHPSHPVKRRNALYVIC